MDVNTLTLEEGTRLSELCERVLPRPHVLYARGSNIESLLEQPKIAIVGSRKVSAYGRNVTTQLAGELAREGVVIISGLALGVDALAHTAALEAGGITIAVLPGPVEQIYPANHHNLAQRILKQGGALLSEYPNGTPTLKYQFIGRNRLVSGLSDALLITEAAVNSGTMHTARFALEQGKDVLAVPGNITSPTSEGTNNLIKAGATPVTNSYDVLNMLGIASKINSKTVRGSNAEEQLILDLLVQNISDGSELLARSELAVDQFNQTLTLLEITGKIKSLGANHWAIY